MKVKKVLGVMVASLCALSMLAACGGGKRQWYNRNNGMVLGFDNRKGDSLF